MKSAVNQSLYNDLRLVEVGMELFIEINFANGTKVQSKSCMIGFKVNKFILIDYPHKGISEAHQHMLNNAEVVVRAMTESGFKDIVAFKAKIYGVVSNPIKMLCLSIPKKITKKKLREQPRVSINESVYIVDAGDKVLARMLDFSFSGCCVVIDEAVSEEILEQGATIKILLSFNESLAGSLSGEVLKVVKADGSNTIGVKFLEEQADLREEIFNYCLINTMR